MRLHHRYVITQLAALAAWLAVSVVALTLWMGISTHARAQMLRTQVSQNITQNSRGPAAFPVEPAARPNVTANAAQCSDYKRQIEQLQKVIALQNQKIALLSKK
jgi:hypothetical protein